MTIQGAFLLGPITLLLLFVGGVPLTTESLPVFIAGGLGSVFWIIILETIAGIFQ